MAIVKRDTISREAFEELMTELKTMIRTGADPEVMIRTINNAEHQMIQYIDEKDAEKFKIPSWMNEIRY